MNSTSLKDSHQPTLFSIPLQQTSTNTPLKGTLRDLGKYEFSFEQRLGSGLTSDAYLGRNKQTQELVCVKIIDLLNFKNESQKELLENEIRCQQNVKSDNIVNFLDILKTNSFCFIVTELCQDGDLFKLIKFSRVGLPEKLVVRFAKQLASALAVLKNNQIVHRDIKSENILLKRGNAKLGDFGFSIQEKNLKQKQDFSLGSPLYMPLEALEHKKYGYQSDIFSYGIVLYEMLHAQSPWECSDEQQLIARMKTEDVNFKTEISQPLKTLIKSCLERDVSKRGSIEHIQSLLSEFPDQQPLTLSEDERES